MRRSHLIAAQVLVAAVSITALMGADAEGCGGAATDPVADEGEGQAPAGLVCEPGFHVDAVCEPKQGPKGEQKGEEAKDDGPKCHEACVPDGVCPRGTWEHLVCGGPPPKPGKPGEKLDEDAKPLPFLGKEKGGGDEAGEKPPLPGECAVKCIPFDRCAPRFHMELVCKEPSKEEPKPEPKGEPEEEGKPGKPELPPPGCKELCVPDPICPPDLIERVVCFDPGKEPGKMGGKDEPVKDERGADELGKDKKPGGCWVECVPPKPLCAPGLHAEPICLDPKSEKAEPPKPCKHVELVCVKDEPKPLCPPEFHEQIVPSSTSSSSASSRSPSTA
ncbi:MAG: hypothetical protein HY744_25760 [Deltaproteobacteria bacterium]|nr:hypothetical protein [Deltaproteobacteria bacterium]